MIKALMKLRINLWPDLRDVTSEPKLLRIHAYFLYKNCPSRLDRLITGKVVGVRGNLMFLLLRHHLCFKKEIHWVSEAAWFVVVV